MTILYPPKFSEGSAERTKVACSDRHRSQRAFGAEVVVVCRLVPRDQLHQTCLVTRATDAISWLRHVNSRKPYWEAAQVAPPRTREKNSRRDMPYSGGGDPFRHWYESGFFIIKMCGKTLYITNDIYNPAPLRRSCRSTPQEALDRQVNHRTRRRDLSIYRFISTE